MPLFEVDRWLHSTTIVEASTLDQALVEATVLLDDRIQRHDDLREGEDTPGSIYIYSAAASGADFDHDRRVAGVAVYVREVHN